MLCKPGLLVKESKEGAMFIEIPSSSDIDFRFQKGGRKSSLNKGGKDKATLPPMSIFGL